MQENSLSKVTTSGSERALSFGVFEPRPLVEAEPSFAFS